MANIKMSDLGFGSLNNIQDGNSGESGDRRRTSPTTAIRMAVESVFAKDTLNNITEFNGVVVSFRPISYPSYSNKTALFEEYLIKSPEDSKADEKPQKYATYAYKVYIPELEPRPAPISNNDPVLVTYPDVYCDIEGYEFTPLELGTLVAVKYEDVENLFNPRIVRKVGGPIQIENVVSEELNEKFKQGIPAVLGGLVDVEFGAKITIQPPRLSEEEQKRYPGGVYEPRTQKAVDLLTNALRQARLPEEWAMLESLHYIMEKESGGQVGRPNYRYDFLPEREPQKISRVDLKPETWERIWESAKKGETGMAGLPAGARRSKGSTATGLGQLTKKNVVEYYPFGIGGIGNAASEAYGFVNYIAKRYGDPDTARAMYGRTGTYRLGDYDWLPEKLRNTDRTKDFKEGY